MNTDKTDITIKNFHCSEHGYVKPIVEPRCPHCPSKLALREQEIVGEIEKLHVGKRDYAEASSKRCKAATIQGAFLEGFRFARNSLQRRKSALLSTITHHY